MLHWKPLNNGYFMATVVAFSFHNFKFRMDGRTSGISFYKTRLAELLFNYYYYPVLLAEFIDL